MTTTQGLPDPKFSLPAHQEVQSISGKDQGDSAISALTLSTISEELRLQTMSSDLVFEQMPNTLSEDFNTISITDFPIKSEFDPVIDNNMTKNEIAATKFLVMKNHLTNALKQASPSAIKDKIQSAIDARKLKGVGKNLTEIAANKFEGINASEKDLHKQVKKTVQAAARTLKKKESTQISIPILKNLPVVISKENDGRFDVLVKEKKLGKGMFGEVFSSISVVSKAPVALKYSIGIKPDDNINFEDDPSLSLKNEARLLKILNKNGPHEGVQGLITVSELKTEDSQIVQKVSKGKIYSQGDFQKQVEILRLTRALGISPNELKNLDDTALKKLISQSLQPIDDKIKQCLKQRQQIISERDGYKLHYKEYLDEKGEFINETPQNILEGYIDFRKRISIINNVIEKEITGLAFNIHRSLSEFIGEEKADSFMKIFNSIILDLKQTDKTDSVASYKKLFAKSLFETSKKCRALPLTLTLKQRMIMGSQLVSGLKHIHKKGIIHGDIKPKNFLWNENEAVIADFGGSQMKKDKHPQIPHSLNYAAGTYMDAMKFYSDQNQEENWFRAGQALDIRATGISLYEIFTGKNIPEWNKSNFYDTATYEQMQQDLMIAGVKKNVSEIIATMCKPLEFNKNNPPDLFPLPVDYEELESLKLLLQYYGFERKETNL
jgi:serine/threonine protein kinase